MPEDGVNPPPEGTGPVAVLSDHFVTRAAALDPIAATFEGIHGHDAELTDYSPSGIDERLQHARATLRELDRAAARRRRRAHRRRRCSAATSRSASS